MANVFRLIEKKNFAYKNKDEIKIKDDDIYYNCNFAQHIPDTDIAANDFDALFCNCNMVRCKSDKAKSRIFDCNTYNGPEEVE